MWGWGEVVRVWVYFEGKTHRICRYIKCGADGKDKSWDDFTIFSA